MFRAISETKHGDCFLVSPHKSSAWHLRRRDRPREIWKNIHHHNESFHPDVDHLRLKRMVTERKNNLIERRSDQARRIIHWIHQMTGTQIASEFSSLLHRWQRRTHCGTNAYRSIIFPPFLPISNDQPFAEMRIWFRQMIRTGWRSEQSWLIESNILVSLSLSCDEVLSRAWTASVLFWLIGWQCEETEHEETPIILLQASAMRIHHDSQMNQTDNGIF